MNYLIGSIKHCGRDRIDIWVKSALRYCKCQVVLLVLDDVIPESLLELEAIGVRLVHNPTGTQTDVNICKWERHYKVRNFLKTLEDSDVVLLTDTLDVVFQRDPFEWFKANAKKDLVLTSEGILHINEPWNMRSIVEDHKEFIEEIKNEEVINSGIMLGRPKAVSNILLHTYIATKGLNPASADQPAMNVVLLSSYIKDQIQIVNSDDNFALHSAVAGPTAQFVPWNFINNYKYSLPILENGEVKNSKTGEVFYLVHQYNRAEEWDRFFKDKYREIIPPKKMSLDNKTAIVVCTKANSSYHDDWKTAFRFNADDYMMCDLSSETPPPSSYLLDFVQDNIAAYSEADLRRSLNFYTQASDRHWWNNGGGRNIIWFYPHFRMLYFYKMHPNYDYYWFFDDDVTFPQNQLYDFVNEHKVLDHDCMISYIFGDLNQANQPDTHDMDERMVAYHSTAHNWLTHYPGDGDKQPSEVTEKYGSYFPLVRLSNKALNVLLEEHEKGYYGYSEGFVPTILNHRGLKLYSIYNKNSEVVVNKDLVVYHRRYHQMTWENL
jgi:hypothetical protein